MPYQPHSFPVSIKGVLIHDGHTVLLKNERDEWELPGGKLELGESAEQCVVREIEEELSLAAEVRTLVDVWVYTIRPDRIVFIVCFGMSVASLDGMRCSLEHKEAEIFAIDQVPDLNMPEGYKGSIAAYAKLLDGSAR